MGEKPGFRIKTIHAYVAVGKDNEEGIIGEQINGVMTPFIAADEKRLKALRQKAIEIGVCSGKKVKLVRFSVREDVEVVTDGKWSDELNETGN